MSTHAKSKFEVKDWNENTYQEVEGGRKLTHATVTQSCQGDIEGEGTVDYLMSYGADGSASFVGLQRVIGRIDGKSGSFVLSLSGKYDKSKAEGSWSVVPGSGTGDLENLRGSGGFKSNAGEHFASATLDYDLD